MSYPPQGLDKADVLANQATALARLTETRAGYLDKLPDIEEDAEHSEQHIHCRNRVFGKSADQSGNNWGTLDSLTPYQCISGDGDFGSDTDDEAKVLGTADTPVLAGRLHFDPGRLTVVATSSTSLWVVRLIWGSSTQSMAEAEAAGQYSDIPFLKESNAGWASIIELRTPRIPVGWKVWVKGKNGTNNATLDFVISSHEYED